VDEWESLVMVLCGQSDVAEPNYIQGHPHEKENIANCVIELIQCQ
jgi:hypothetical protein